MENITDSIFLVLDRQGEPAGAGFLVAPGLGITCASAGERTQWMVSRERGVRNHTTMRA